MLNQYYAILMRDADFNDELLSEEERNSLTPEELEQANTTIVFVGKTYKETYDEFQKLKVEYPKAVKESGYHVARTIEFCIARITVLNSWEILPSSS